jgi:hypothetical protein
MGRKMFKVITLLWDVGGAPIIVVMNSCSLFSRIFFPFHFSLLISPAQQSKLDLPTHHQRPSGRHYGYDDDLKQNNNCYFTITRPLKCGETPGNESLVLPPVTTLCKQHSHHR